MFRSDPFSRGIRALKTYRHIIFFHSKKWGRTKNHDL